MDFYILKEEIVKSLNLTLGVVEKRQTLPILSNVLIEVDESSLKLTATDLESEISTTSTISNFNSGGKTTAPARKLSEFCRLLPDMAEIHFFLDGDNLKIESGSGKYNLSTLPSDDFPVFEFEDSQGQINISSENLKTIIMKTSFAMGNQDWRQYLNGLFISIDDKNIQTLVLPNVSEFVQPIIFSLPIQLLAYYTAVFKKTDVDQPRNLAKSVTVE